MPRSWHTHSSRSTPPSPIIWASAWPSPGASGAVIAAQCPSRASPAQARRCGSPPLPLPPPSPDGTRQLTGRTGPVAESENRLSLVVRHWGDEKLGLPLVSIRPGIVARSGGEIPVPPYVRKGGYNPFPPLRRGDTGGSQWPGSMTRVSQAPGRRDGHDHSPSLEPHSGGGS